MYENFKSPKEIRDEAKQFVGYHLDAADLFCLVNEELDPDNWSEKDIDDVYTDTKRYLTALSKTLDAL